MTTTPIRQSFGRRFAALRRRFLVPAALCLILTLLTVVQPYRDQNAPVYRAELSLFAAVCWSTLCCLFAEACGRERFRWLFALAGAAAAGLLAWFLNQDVIFLGLIFSAAVLCLYLCSLGPDRRSERLCRAASAVLFSFGLSLLVFGVLNLLMLAVTSLLGPDMQWETRSLLMSACSSAAFLLAAPLALFSLLPPLDAPVPERKSVLQRVLAYVILPAYLALLMVLLLYLLLILVRRELPVGQLNPFALEAVGVYTVLHLGLSGDESRLSAWFVKRGAWPLIPVLIAQGIAVGVRVDAYGLTAARVFGIAFTLVCLTAVVAGLLRRRGWAVLPAAAAALLLLTVTPVNAWNIARHDQEGRLMAALRRSGMLAEDGTVIPRPDLPDREKEILWSSLTALFNDPDLPADSPAADVVRQAQEASGEAHGSAGVWKILGFTVSTPDGSSYRYRAAKGAADHDEVDVRGFSHARWIYETLDRETGYTADVGGHPVTREMLLPLADFDRETLTRDRIVFADGAELRLSRISVNSYQDDWTHPATTLRFSGWLLTP